MDLLFTLNACERVDYFPYFVFLWVVFWRHFPRTAGTEHFSFSILEGVMLPSYKFSEVCQLRMPLFLVAIPEDAGGNVLECKVNLECLLCSTGF